MKPRIDHFYIVVPQVHFDLLKRRFQNETFCEVKKVVSNQGSWEGIYLGFKNGFYLEILKPEKDFKAYRTGLCLSHMGHEKYTSSFIKKNGLKKELFKKDGKRWFYAYFKEEQKKSSFIPWFTSYLGTFKNCRRCQFKKSSLNKKVIQISIPDKYIKPILDNSDWLSLDIQRNGEKLIIKDSVMELQIKPSRSFKVRIA